MKRENGFYWVIHYNFWVVAEWSSADWYITGVDSELEDCDFKEIDERRIVRDEPATRKKTEG